MFGILALVLLALASNRYSDFDLRITSAFYDAAVQRFPYRHHPVWTLLHDGQKWFAVGVGVLLLCIWLYREVRRDDAAMTRRIRRFTLYTLSAALLSAGAVSLAKGSSSHSCPWDLSAYGGTADYYRIAQARPPHPGPGRCLPSGHASTAFMWIAAVYGCRRWFPSWRVLALRAVLTLGALASATQIVRGAHFLSHIVLSAALCWAICALADGLAARYFFSGRRSEMSSIPAKRQAGGIARLVRAWAHSRAGFKAAWRHEAAFRQEVLLAAVLIPVALYATPGAAERALLIGSLGLVLVTELVNTAVESVVDFVSTAHHPLAGMAKDVASAAVLTSLLFAAAIWGIVLSG